MNNVAVKMATQCGHFYVIQATVQSAEYPIDFLLGQLPPPTAKQPWRSGCCGYNG